MSKYTPGPWVHKSLEPSTIGHDWVDGPDRRCVASCHEIVANGPHGYCLSVDTDEIAANARLIAAAPALLEALQLFMHDWRGEQSPPRKVRIAQAAIKLATGETK